MSVTPEEALETLHSRAVRARAAEEAHAAEVLARVRRTVQDRLPPGVRAWLIGSLAWGGFGVRSDVDLVVRGAAPAAATALEVELICELKLEVDVLRMEDLPGGFRERVEREGVRLDGPA